MIIAKGTFRIEAVVRHNKKKDIDIFIRLMEGWKQFEQKPDTFRIRGLHPVKGIDPGWAFKGEVLADSYTDEDPTMLIYP